MSLLSYRSHISKINKRFYQTSRNVRHSKGLFGVEGLNRPEDWKDLAQQSVISTNQMLNDLKDYKSMSPSKVLFYKMSINVS